MLELMPFVLLGTVSLLIVLLAARINDLYQNYDTHEACFSLALKFAHKQLGKLGTDSNTANESICLYLIGAMEFLGRQHKYSAQERRVVTIKVLNSFYEISPKELSDYYVFAAKREPNSIQDKMVRNGARAAKLWLKEQKTTPELDLNTQLNNWGLATA